MDKVKYGIHHQAVVDCPKCGELIVTDLGEYHLADGIELTCPECGSSFELEGEFV